MESKKKSTGFVVIGGQYTYYDYGVYPTLPGAKRIATRNAEYWDNWQGWHVPTVYKAEDTYVVENFYGTVRAPKPGALPVAVYNNDAHRWLTDEELRWHNAI